jgi:Na+-driven multidrug efflux pump
MWICDHLFFDREALAALQTGVAYYASVYARGYLLSAPVYAAYEVLRRFLQCQSMVRPMLYTSAVTTSSHVLWLGFMGAPVAVAITMFLNFALLLLYVLIKRPHRAGTWTGWSRECLRDAPRYIKNITNCICCCSTPRKAAWQWMTMTNH